MKKAPLFLLALVAIALAAADAAALDDWLKSREDGLDAARESGKPVLVVTLWKDGI